MSNVGRAVNPKYDAYLLQIRSFGCCIQFGNEFHGRGAACLRRERQQFAFVLNWLNAQTRRVSSWSFCRISYFFTFIFLKIAKVNTDAPSFEEIVTWILYVFPFLRYMSEYFRDATKSDRAPAPVIYLVSRISYLTCLLTPEIEYIAYFRDATKSDRAPAPVIYLVSRISYLIDTCL